MTLTVGHGNVHNRPSAVRAAVRLRCDVFGFNEAGRRRSLLAGFRGYRLHVAQPVMGAPPSPKGRDVSGDTATLIRKELPYLGEWQQQVSQQWDPASRIAPDRWFNVSCFAWGGLRIAHVNVHPNAGGKVLRERPDHPITREYRESMEWLDTMLAVYRQHGWALLVTGDLNLPDVKNDPAWSPWPRLEKHGLEHRAKHIDAVAWSAGHFRLRDFDVIPKEAFGSDHPALRVRLEKIG